jgi:CheY-like chemotaxis protein
VFNISELLLEVINIFNPLIKQAEFKTKINIQKTAYFVQGDFESIERVFTNLILNAIQHTGKNQTLSINTRLEKEKYIVTINNTGALISKNVLPKNIKFTGVETETINPKVRGMSGHRAGLKFVSLAAQKNNIEINVKALPDKGTEFTLAFGKAKNTKKKEVLKVGVTTESLYMEKPVFNDIKTIENRLKQEEGRYTILFIEDNLTVLGLIAEQLNKEFNIAIAKNGVDGISLANEISPDLIITDIDMPGDDGFTVVKSIKSCFNTGHIPVLIFSAITNRDVNIEGLKIGADDVITKPIDMSVLSLKIRNRLASNRALWLKLSESQFEKPETKPEGTTISLEEMEELNAIGWVKKLHSYLEENIADKEKLKVPAIGEHMGLQRKPFAAKMKALGLGATSVYARKYKLSVAHRKIKEAKGRIKIMQLAAELGMTHAALTNEFKGQYKITPGDFRDSLKK